MTVPRRIAAAQHAREHGLSIVEAADLYGVSALAVYTSWSRLYPGVPHLWRTPKADSTELRAITAARYARAQHVTRARAAVLHDVQVSAVIAAWERLFPHEERRLT